MKRGSRPRSQLKTLQTGLSEVLGEEQQKRLGDICRVRRDWAKIVGPVLAQHTEPLNIEKGCLHIAVDHPVMAQQIRFLQEKIRQACFKQCRVTGISNMRSRHQPGAGIPTKSATRIVSRRLSLSDKKAIAKELSLVRNKSLRFAMFEARVNQQRYQTQPET